MLPTLPMIVYPEFQYGALVLSAVISFLMVSMCLHTSIKPGLIGYLCLFSGLSGVITAAILFASSGLFLFETAVFPFYGIYIVFMFLPVLISFHRIAKQQQLEDNSKTSIRMGTALVYLGYIWSVIFYATTIAVTVIQSSLKRIDLDAADYPKKALMYATASNFLLRSRWAFIAINLILTVLFYKYFDHKSSRRALICFNIFTIISMITETVYLYIDYPKSDQDALRALGFVYIFLVDLPNSMAILAWFITNGHRVNAEKTGPPNQIEEEESRRSYETIPVPHFKETHSPRQPAMDYRP